MIHWLACAQTEAPSRSQPVRRFKNFERVAQGQYSIRIDHQWRVCFVRKSDVSPSRISGLVNGARPITADTALRLGLFFSMEPRFWLSLHNEYDMRMAVRETKAAIERCICVFRADAAVACASCKR
jgi:addiction module HigA family antidote